jgi:hypothetical protein
MENTDEKALLDADIKWIDKRSAECDMQIEELEHNKEISPPDWGSSYDRRIAITQGIAHFLENKRVELVKIVLLLEP